MHSSPARLSIAALVASAALTLGCGLVFSVAEVVTYPMDKDGTFHEAQLNYTNNIRYGLYDDAREAVEPELHAAFDELAYRIRDVRFTGYRIESVDLDPMATHATVVVLYTGYGLGSPYEREVRLVQKWRRAVPSQDWYVTPELDKLLDPKALDEAVSLR